MQKPPVTQQNFARPVKVFDAVAFGGYVAAVNLEDTTMAMADDNQVNNDLDESKRDTIRINLPQGGAGNKPPAMPTPTVRLRPAPAPNVAPSTDARKATAAIALPTATPAQPKKATSAVAPAQSKKDTAAIMPNVPPQTKKATAPVTSAPPVIAPTASKPTIPEMPRPTVKLKREEPPAVAAPVVEAETAAPETDTAAAPTNMLDVGLALAAMVVALAVAGYLFKLSNG